MARTTKKDIYANFGIDFNGKKIYCEHLDMWIAPFLKKGNTKLGKQAWAFSMLPTALFFVIALTKALILIIKGTCSCTCTGCYATKGCYNFPSTKRSLAISTVCAREALDFLERAIKAQIIADKITIVRVHASGDFINDDYANMWKRIALANEDVIFWTYTKVQKYEGWFDGVKNFNVVKSVIPNVGFNFGHCDYILSCYELLTEAGKNVYICKCGTVSQRKCSECGICRTYEYVLFVEHSTEYDYSTDPLWPVLEKVIMAQNDIDLR